MALRTLSERARREQRRRIAGVPSLNIRRALCYLRPMRLHFARQLGTALFIVGLVGCAESHIRGDDADGSVSGRDGSVRDAGPLGDAGPRDASTVGDGAIPGRDLGRVWREVCGSACVHAVGCGAVDLGTAAQCTNECSRAETDFTTTECRDLAFEAITCLESLACEDIRGLTPEETLCAPLFARLNRTCGGG